MKNILSKIFQVVKTGKEVRGPPRLKIGEKLDIYIHVLETYEKGKNEADRCKDLKEGKFILLNGTKGIFKIENVSELGHSAQYKLELVRENLPKNYSECIEKINNYSTKYIEDSFNIMP